MDRAIVTARVAPSRARRGARVGRLLVVLVIVAAVVAGCGDDTSTETPDILDPSDDEPANDDDTSSSAGDGGDDDVAVGTFPARAPEVTGRLVVDDGEIHLAEASDDYYAEMMLVEGDDGVLVVDEGGDPVSWDDLAEGMLVDVWVAGACAESYPVQCDLEALRVDLES
jgi:hypothetical protein